MSKQDPNGEAPLHVFDRPRDQHRWRRAFAELATDATWSAVCENWRMDHRVSEAREEAMLGVEEFIQEPDGEGWRKQLSLHFKKRLCRSATSPGAGEGSAYSLAPNNANRLPPRLVVPRNELIHVSSLNSILRRLGSRRPETAALEWDFEDLTGAPLPRVAENSGEEFNLRVDEVATTVNGLGPEVVKALAGLLTTALGSTTPPWWSAFAEELQSPLEAKNATGLCCALGLGHVRQGEWLIVWLYPCSLLYRQSPDAALYRPTVVEAFGNGYHFPSPPAQPFGVTMPLREGLGDGRMGACREVLHPPLVGALASEACTGELLPVAEAPLRVDNDLLSLRRRHRKNLLEVYSEPGLQPWLDRHPEPIEKA